MILTALLVLTLAPVPQEQSVPVREVLAIERLGVRRRSAVYTDTLEAALARGTLGTPEEGATLLSADGEERTWTRFEAGDDGWFSGRPFRNGWAYTTVEVPRSGAWRLDVAGHSAVLVDGAPRGGDIYSLGTTRLPLWLEAGRHELLFRCGRGRLRATLEPAPAPVYLEEKDRTLPDILRGEAGRLHLGLIISNAGMQDAKGYSVVAHHAAGSPTTTLLPAIPRSSQRKCQVDVEVPADALGDSLEIRIELVDPEGTVVHASTFGLAIRDANGKHSRTFVSEIDGSVQYFAVNPPPSPTDGERPAMILTLHGAGVEGRGQAGSYAPKDWAVIVAPTNRRPYGFDWEDWGRLDAMEVLSIAEKLYDTDPQRTYLTGHSMGGHGTWQIGVQFPGRFAAIAPSAGWSDFWSYGGGGTFPQDDPLGPLFTRAVNVSRTRLLERNFLHGGVYVLHGDADNNVPVREARDMRSRLAGFHPNFAYYERPGAGHWWGGACVDWPPLMAFLKDNRLPDPATQFDVEFTTANPGVSDHCYWVSIEAQERWLEPSRVRARLDTAERSIALELTNVTRVIFDLSAFTLPRGEQEPALEAGGPLRIEVDGSEIEVPFETADARVGLQRDGEGTWRPVGNTPAWNKGPHRAGTFKDAFRHRPVLVYGTTGNVEENNWSFAKARYDHETWRYRGNGAFEVVADVDFRPADHEDRNVVLYGNRDTNAAWSVLLESVAFDLCREFVRVGERQLEGDDLALLAIYPRRDSDVASVAVVGGTGLPGCHTTDYLPYFVSGVAYPDWTVFGVDFLTDGLEGVRGAGFFSAEWSAEEGAEAVWR